MEKTDNDKFIFFQNKLNEADSVLSDFTMPFNEAYNPKVSSLKETLLHVFEDKVPDSHEKKSSINLGLRFVDDEINGLENGSLTIIGTNLMSCTLPVSIVSKFISEEDSNLRIGIISAKNTLENVVTRLLAIYTNSSVREIYNLSLSEKEFKKVKSVCESLYDKPIFINANSFPSLEEFKATAIKMRYENDIDILFVESFECVGNDVKSSFKNDFEMYRCFSRYLKELAVFLDIPVVVSLFQLNNDETHATAMDFAGSGISSEYVDNILFCDFANDHRIRGNKYFGCLHLLKGKSYQSEISISYNTNTTEIDVDY